MAKMHCSTIDQVPVTKENINTILEFLPYFEDKSNYFFEFIKKQEDKPGIYHFPYYKPSPEILDFIYTLKMENFLLPYDWEEDMPQVGRFINGKRSIAEASLSDIRKIFITLSVGEKFCEGYLANAVNSGIVLDALKRLEEIRKKI